MKIRKESIEISDGTIEFYSYVYFVRGDSIFHMFAMPRARGMRIRLDGKALGSNFESTYTISHETAKETLFKDKRKAEMYLKLGRV